MFTQAATLGDKHMVEYLLDNYPINFFNMTNLSDAISAAQKHKYNETVIELLKEAQKNTSCDKDDRFYGYDSDEERNTKIKTLLYVDCRGCRFLDCRGCRC